MNIKLFYGLTGNETKLAHIVAEHGPMAVLLDATIAFQFYVDGFFSIPLVVILSLIMHCYLFAMNQTTGYWKITGTVCGALLGTSILGKI